MNFSTALYTSREIANKSSLIISFSEATRIYFENRFYGDDLKSIIIGLVCVSPQSEAFFKIRKPKYTREKKSMKSEGFEYENEKYLEYDVKIDFESFKNATEGEAKRMLAKEILESLVVFEKMKSKIKNFDIEKFKYDLEEYFKNQKLI